MEMEEKVVPAEYMDRTQIDPRGGGQWSQGNFKESNGFHKGLFHLYREKIKMSSSIIPLEVVMAILGPTKKALFVQDKRAFQHISE